MPVHANYSNHTNYTHGRKLSDFVLLCSTVLCRLLSNTLALHQRGRRGRATGQFQKASPCLLSISAGISES